MCVKNKKQKNKSTEVTSTSVPIAKYGMRACVQRTEALVYYSSSIWDLSLVKHLGYADAVYIGIE